MHSTLIETAVGKTSKTLLPHIDKRKRQRQQPQQQRQGHSYRGERGVAENPLRPRPRACRGQVATKTS